MHPCLGDKKLRSIKIKTIDDYYHFLETEAEPATNMGKHEESRKPDKIKAFGCVSSVPEVTRTPDLPLRRKIYPLPYGSLTHLFMLFHVKNVLVEPSLLCFFIAYCTILSTTINFR